MTFFNAVISGVIQGLTEFLPVSSSGHLVVLHKLMGIEKPQILFDIFLHLGTLAAIFIVFGRDMIESITTKKKLGAFILIASIVTLIFVIFFVSRIEAAFDNIKIVGTMFLVTGAWLILGNFVRFGTEGLSGFKAAIIGLAQGISSIPGISRSGATISTGLFLGLDGQTAAKFSFLLAIPAIIGAFLFKIRESSFTFSEINVYYFIGFITACGVGIGALKLLLRILYSNKFHWFGIYCIVLGLLVLIFL